MEKQIDQDKIHTILTTLKELEYGCVTITVHEGDITQIDITEKKRFALKKKQQNKK
ncbi:YezD family protein [Cytobacillus kochii]|uniref:YezD family protein n=1 Tax=Cytobacillus kochii TaxID=859143 RepID=UPI002E1E5326|nr:YezD family protein [Cytobacillus kochii]